MMRRNCPALLVLVLAIFLALFAGNGAIGTGDILRVLSGGGTAGQKLIVFQVRLPRITAAMGAGAALSVSGYLLQGSLDNRVASPGILGINNGAGLFVLISAVFFPYRTDVKCLFAFVGAVLVTIFVSLLSSGTGMSKTSVILSGVAISAACVSLIDVIISLRPETVADKAAFQLGGFAAIQPAVVRLAMPMIGLGLFASVMTAPEMDLLALGDETAHGLGLDVKRSRWVLVLEAALLSAAAISMSGMISFVGLIVPNVVRIIYHGRSRGSVVLCMLYGAAFLLFCDTIARLAAFPYELPCGLLLSMMGAPCLIAILIKKRKRLGIE